MLKFVENDSPQEEGVKYLNPYQSLKRAIIRMFFFPVPGFYLVTIWPKLLEAT